MAGAGGLTGDALAVGFLMYHGKDAFVSSRSTGYGPAMKLYRFSYSPFARKVQMVLELLGRPHELVDVPYSDRDELASITGGYIVVPVWVCDGQVTVESRRICERLLAEDAAQRLTPPPLA